MGRDRQGDGYMMTRIVFRGVLKDKGRRDGRLASYPDLQQVGYGSTTRYVIRGAEHSERFYVAEFSTTGITMELYAKASTSHFMREALLRLLGIASFIDSAYTFDISSLFPYIIEVLARPEFVRYEGKAVREQGHNGVEIILGKRIVELRQEVAAQHKQAEQRSRNVLRLLSSYIPVRYSGVCAVSKIAVDTGLEEREVRAAIGLLEGTGYVANWRSRDEFNMVPL